MLRFRHTTYSHTIEHSHTIQTVGCHIDTSSLTTQHVKGIIVGRTLVGMISNYLNNITSIVNGIFPFCRNLLLCMSQRTAKECNEK